MAAAYSVSYLIGLLITALRLRRRLEGRLDGRRLCRTYGKLTTCAMTAAALGWLIARTSSAIATSPTWSSALGLAAGGVAMALVFLLFARVLKVTELGRLPGRK
jgi:putative peptidoglycan lipid II flippase